MHFIQNQLILIMKYLFNTVWIACLLLANIMSAFYKHTHTNSLTHELSYSQFISICTHMILFGFLVKIFNENPKRNHINIFHSISNKVLGYTFEWQKWKQNVVLYTCTNIYILQIKRFVSPFITQASPALNQLLAYCEKWSPEQTVRKPVQMKYDDFKTQAKIKYESYTHAFACI